MARYPMTSLRRLRMPGGSRYTAAQLLTLSICLGFGLAFAIANAPSWELEDAQAYWHAAERLRDGGPLYVPVDPGADEMLAYRYAPWWAWLWVPLTWLPKTGVEVAWSAVLVAASVFAVLRILSYRTVASVCVAALLGGLLIRTASTGNVHALMIGVLMWGIPRRSGPIWIGIAASLKVLPILFVIPYVGRGEWRRVGLAVGLAAALALPAMLYDLSAYPADAGPSLSLLSNLGIVPFLLVAVALIALAVGLSRGRYAWIAASAAVLATLPRLELYSLTYLLAGANDNESREASADGGKAKRPIPVGEPGHVWKRWRSRSEVRIADGTDDIDR